ncbi:monovalent cation/H+ antiporter subunit E [Halodesulfurarchaeum formicicum]|uniref:Monovalent cation/H+ antiporter subunit E n=1 Tax=Halodesulfurarchaeum formicicum TaxID=1873524 RepID=A0A1J1ABI9_9EURY|nr:monovalent cation/H+ antiporter subunit E [Halodesulfurarchaeum formicicum]APE95508.1 monovalent cation/H+ antiporter subunit E [Halodesulfurarchaeum formicicum]
MAESSARILVPVGDSSTLRNTVAHAVREGLEGEPSQARAIHFVYPIRWRPVEGTQAVPEDAQELLERVAVWAREDLEDVDGTVEVVTDTVGADRYLFSPDDYATVLQHYAAENDLDRVILDPEYVPTGGAPMLAPLKTALSGDVLTVEEAPVTRPAQRTPLPSRATLSKTGIVFGSAYGFYLLIAGSLSQFNLLTGALAAGLVAAIFGSIAVTGRQSITTLFARLGRMATYVPYLLWEIAKANLTVAYIILHPRLPIDPGMQRFEAAVWGDMSVTTLANSITLTPGTLTVDVRHDSLFVHSLNQSARDGLASGDLERAVRYVFWGPSGRELKSPVSRGAIETFTPNFEEEPDQSPRADGGKLLTAGERK